MTWPRQALFFAFESDSHARVLNEENKSPESLPCLQLCSFYERGQQLVLIIIVPNCKNMFTVENGCTSRAVHMTTSQHGNNSDEYIALGGTIALFEEQEES